MRLVRTGLAAWVLFNVGLLMAAAPAAAELTGGCTATIAGQDPATLSSSDPSDAIPVQEGSTVGWQFNAPTEIVAWSSTLHYGPFSIELDSGTDPADDDAQDTSKGGEANVDQYAWMGTGLYKLTATVTPQGGPPCEGAVLVHVQGNPLTTVAGGSAAVATACGCAGVGAATLAGFKAGGLLGGVL